MTSYQPLISIVIPAYNASNYLACAIDSALAQTYPNVEIIVVNDGSKDDGATRAVALSYGDRIRYFEKENGGSSSALNTGIAHMQGEWFSWLSHDDLYTPEKLATQVAYLRNLELASEDLPRQVLFSASEEIDGEGRVLHTPKPSVCLARSRAVASASTNARLIAEPTECNFHGCSCLVHRQVFEDIGAFDETLRLLNDYDLWFRIYAAGYRIHMLPEILVQGRIHRAQVSRSIGFSYHNPEQDMFWNRSLDWLIEHASNEYELFRLFACNAYRKTRDAEGDRALSHALSLRPEQKGALRLMRMKCRLYAKMRTFAKKIYLKLR